jgi:hypothetical protein
MSPSIQLRERDAVSVSSRFPVRKATPAGGLNMAKTNSMTAVIHNYDMVSEAQHLFAVVRPVPLTKYKYSINTNYKIPKNIKK